MSVLSWLFYISLLMIIAMAIIPVTRFLLYQWDIRKQEFLGRLRDKSLSAYLSRFHGNVVRESADDFEVFITLYNRIAGRHLYYFPLFLLLVAIGMLGGLAIATAIRTGYEQYLLFYQSWLGEEGKISGQVSLTHESIEVLNAAVFPFSNIALSLQALAAISGAYLYVVGVVIQGFRARTLLSSDLLWCSFRMVIAVPLGLSLGAVANPTLGSFVAFALGAFPIEAINRILRHLLNKSLNQTDDEKSDQLVNLIGVTPEVSAALNGEGISAVQELASMDPVAMAMRTGLPFDYVLNLVAQSQSWCYIGSTVGALSQLGFGDARVIARLSQRLDSNPPDQDAENVLAGLAAAAKVDAAVLRFAFKNISADSYTKFLLQFG